jgi:DNA-binding PadR family transcriptional regulator
MDLPEDRSDGLAPVLPREYLRPCLLLLLREETADGDDLFQRLSLLGDAPDDPARVYSTLRALEDEGLVRLAWERFATGPNRRVYELTGLGRERLAQEARALAELRGLLSAFAGRYEEFVLLRREPGAAEPPATRPGSIPPAARSSRSAR